MRSIFIVLVILCSLSLSTNTYAQESRVVKTKYFKNLNKFDEAKDFQWYVGEFEIAKELEKSYELYSSKKNFKKQLIKFADNSVDKFYWIATYLEDDYYTEINDSELALELYMMGLKLAEQTDEREQIRYLYVLGKKYYHQGDKEKSLSLLLKGYELAEKYPGNIPTWQSLEEADQITDFILKNR